MFEILFPFLPGVCYFLWPVIISQHVCVLCVCVCECYSMQYTAGVRQYHQTRLCIAIQAL